MKERQNQWEKVYIWGLMASFAALAFAFSLGPIFEGPDEIEHYRFLRYLKEYGELPDMAGQPYGQYHQAPLYYWLLLPFANFLPDEDFAEIDGRLNPYHGYQFEQAGNDNKNLYLHHWDENFPYASPTARAVHLLRLTSIALGTATVWLSYHIFRLLWPENSFRRLLALSIIAFWPQFIYLSSVLNNDNLAIFWASLSLYLLLKQYREGVTWRGASLLGIVLGLALLSKASLGLLAIPMAFITICDRRRWKTAPLTLGITVAIAGWWYLRSYLAYGDFLGANAMLTTWPNQALHESGEMDFLLGLSRLPYAYQSMWARFGAGSVAVATWIYHFFDIRLIAALIGLIMMAYWQRAVWRKNLILVLLLLIFALTWLFSVLSSASMASAGNQGRYLFPGIVAWAAILALGLDVYLTKFHRSLWLVNGISVVICLIALFAYFFPAYQALPVPSTIAAPLNLRYENAAELLGMSPSNPIGRAGEHMRIEIYWRALAPAKSTLQSYIHTAFAENLLWRDSIPANGHRPADDWQAGETWAERYDFRIPEDVIVGEYLIVAGLYEASAGISLMAYDEAGNPIDTVPVIGILKIVE